jgi:hypothetical protein
MQMKETLTSNNTRRSTRGKEVKKTRDRSTFAQVEKSNLGLFTNEGIPIPLKIGARETKKVTTKNQAQSQFLLQTEVTSQLRKNKEDINTQIRELWEKLASVCECNEKWNFFFSHVLCGTFDKEQLQEMLFPVKAEKPQLSFDEKVEYVLKFEDLTWVAIEKIRQIPALAKIIPTAKSIKSTWTNDLNEDIFDKANGPLAIEQENGMELDTTRFTTILLENYVMNYYGGDIHRYVEALEKENFIPSLVWTVDYGKSSALTTGGFGFIDSLKPSENQNSSLSYHLNSAFIKEESTYNFKNNLKNSLEFMKSKNPLLYRDGTLDIKIDVRKEVLFDLEALRKLLGMISVTVEFMLLPLQDL